MEILFHSHLDSNTVITTIFCTWHDSCRGMCKNLLRSDGQQRNYSKAKFPSNLNCGQKIVSETGPCHRDLTSGQSLPAGKWSMIKQVNTLSCMTECQWGKSESYYIGDKRENISLRTYGNGFHTSLNVGFTAEIYHVLTRLAVNMAVNKTHI